MINSLNSLADKVIVIGEEESFHVSVGGRIAQKVDCIKYGYDRVVFKTEDECRPLGLFPEADYRGILHSILELGIIQQEIVVNKR